MLARLASTAALVLAVALPAIDANASFPPKSFKSTRTEMARACEALGSDASYDAWQYKPGEYGCANLSTGNIVICQHDGSCKLYFGALPRKRGIKMTV
jgi:hypothetical protein